MNLLKRFCVALKSVGSNPERSYKLKKFNFMNARKIKICVRKVPYIAWLCLKKLNI